MSGKIFFVNDNGELTELNENQYDSEALLQSLLENYPHLLAGDQINANSPRRWLLISRESSVPCEEGGMGRWSLDHLYLDQDGIPTLLEVKRSSDTRIRREVVGQLLDYAANAVLYWDLEQIRNQFDLRCKKLGLNPDEELQNFLGPDNDQTAFWEKVKTNLEAEKIRLIFVADRIPQELQRIVEFLNGQMERAEVLALEIKQYAGKGNKILVPRIVGQTIEAQRVKTKGLKSREWDEDSFLSDLRSRTGDEEVFLARKILSWIGDNSLTVKWGAGGKDGTFYPCVQVGEKQYKLFGVYSSGKIEVDFRHHALQTQEQREELFKRIVGLGGISWSERIKESWGSFPLIILKDNKVDRFLDIFIWVLKELKDT